MITLSFSAMSLVLPLRRIPAVSRKRYILPCRSTTVSTASRVVPGSGDTMDRSAPSQLVQQRGFPDVRPADDGDIDVRLGLDRSPCGKSSSARPAGRPPRSHAPPKSGKPRRPARRIARRGPPASANRLCSPRSRAACRRGAAIAPAPHRAARDPAAIHHLHHARWRSQWPRAPAAEFRREFRPCPRARFRPYPPLRTRGLPNATLP